MMPSSSIVRITFIVPVLFVAAIQADTEADTPLDRYVHAPDPTYSWKLVGQHVEDWGTTFTLEMTSQTWRTAAEIDRPVWKHWLVIARPKAVQHSRAFLYITGGVNDDPAPDKAGELVTQLAQASGSVVAELRMVPNQPLAFTDSPAEHRHEDDLVAYSRVKYFQSRDPNVLVRLAMVKSGVRAMDAVTEFMKSEEGGGITIDGFVVAGGSKRGWTTWLVGAVDPRVIAIVPIVIDALNSELVTRHHFEVYGFFSPALEDYVHHGLFPHKIGTPEYREVLAIEDPFQYRNRPAMKMPKYIVNAAGDEFFLPDNWQFYYPVLPPEKHLRYVPNAKHNLQGSDAALSILAFYKMILAGQARPRYDWKRRTDGTIEVSITDPPREMNLWRATNAEARDFRLDVIGPAWEKVELPRPSATPPGKPLEFRIDSPARGYTCFFVELVYGSEDAPFKVTTGTSILPDKLPFRWEDAAAKYPLPGR